MTGSMEVQMSLSMFFPRRRVAVSLQCTGAESILASTWAPMVDIRIRHVLDNVGLMVRPQIAQNRL